MSDCKGNGFIRVPYEQAREEVHDNVILVYPR